MDLRLLEYFLAVVDHGGFGRAADALHVAQPSLSQAIARLERETKVELFHRVGRGVVLSDAGRALVQPARQVMRDVELAQSVLDSTKGLESGHVHLATMSSPGIEPLGAIARNLQHHHPGIVLHTHAAFEPNDVIRMVREGESELGLAGTPVPIHPPGLEMIPIEAEGFLLVSPPGQGHLEGGPVDLAALTNIRVVASPPGSLMRTIVDDAMAAGGDVRIVAEVAHRTSVLPFVLQGVGSAVVPSSWTALAQRTGLEWSPLSHPARLHVALLQRSAPLSPAAQAFVDEVHQYRRRLRSHSPAADQPAASGG